MESDLEGQNGPRQTSCSVSTEAEPKAATRTLGFLFSDLRGYTQLIDKRGDSAAAEIVRDYRRLARAAIDKFGGQEIGTERDSFFVVFDSVAAAVQCGMGILRATGANDPPIRVGVGVHAGEAVAGELGYVTGPVNLAARLCAQARAGQILVSDTVRALTRMAIEVRYESAGPKRFKGFDEPVSVWRVEVEGAARSPEDGLPGRRLLLGMLAALAVSVVQLAIQDYFFVTNALILGVPVQQSFPLRLFPVLYAVGAVYTAGNLADVVAVAARWPGTARLAARILVLNCVLTAALIPVYSITVVTTSPTGSSGAFLIAFGVLSMAIFLGTVYGLIRRRAWVVGLAYAACAIFAISVTALPLAIAAGWAIRERRENTLY